MITSPVSPDEKVSRKLSALESEDEKYGGWYRCHLRDMSVASHGLSRESGNLLRKTLELRCRRTGFPPFGKLRAGFSRE
jgi:hypothetical protein